MSGANNSNKMNKIYDCFSWKRLGSAFAVSYAVVLALCLCLQWSPSLQRHVMYLHYVTLTGPAGLIGHVRWQFGREKERQYGVESVKVEWAGGEVRGYYARNPSSIDSLADSSSIHDARDDVVIFIHGNCATRALPWRKRHLLLLADVFSHAYSIDVRGYGDVPGFPTERGVVEDAVKFFEFVKERHGVGSRVFFYGHSMGGAIASGAVSKIQACGDGGKRHPMRDDARGGVQGVIIDASFSNGTVAALNHFSTLPIRALVPYASSFIRSAIVDRFDSDVRLGGVDVPVFIMHARSDWEIPIGVAGGLALRDQIVGIRCRRYSKGARVRLGCDADGGGSEGGAAGVQVRVYEGFWTGHENIHGREEFRGDVGIFRERVLEGDRKRRNIEEVEQWGY